MKQLTNSNGHIYVIFSHLSRYHICIILSTIDKRNGLRPSAFFTSITPKWPYFLVRDLFAISTLIFCSLIAKKLLFTFLVASKKFCCCGDNHTAIGQSAERRSVPMLHRNIFPKENIQYI